MQNRRSKQEPGNAHDSFTVSVCKNDDIVGHVPRTIAACFWVNQSSVEFLSQGDTLVICPKVAWRYHVSWVEEKK